MRNLVILAACAAPAFAWAQPVTGPYVSLGGGSSLQQNEIALPAPLLGRLHDNNWKFDAGALGEVSTGYGLGNGFRAELEGDYLSNHVREYSAPNPRRAGGFETKYGGMLNVLYDANVGLPFLYPYVGLGAGGQIVEQHNFNQSTPGFVLPGNGGTEGVGAFAFQGIAGVSVPVPWVRGLSFTMEYRFLGLLDPTPAFLRRGEVVELGSPISVPPATPVSPSNPVTLGSFTPPPVVILPTGHLPLTHEAISNVHFTNNYNHSVLIGLRYALFQPAPPAPPAPLATAPAPAPEAARTYLVFFDWDRADLTSRARQIVAEAAQASTRVHTTTIAVNGYTDLSGTAAYNLRLSVRRGDSVKAELVRDGVPASEVEIRGHGESDPLVPTAAGVREPQNRRVEIILQ